MHSRDVGKEIEHAYSHDEHGSDLSGCIRRESHDEGEDGAAEEAHDHQAGYLVLLVGDGLHGPCEHHGEHVAVAVAHEADGDVEDDLGLSHGHAHHRQRHHHHGDDEECAVVHHAEEERAREAAYRTADEVKRRGERGLIEGHAQTLDEQLGGRRVRADVYAHMAHDAEEGEQHDGSAQQLEALAEGRGLALKGSLPDLRG